MNTKVKLDVLYYSFGDTLINFFEKVVNEDNNLNFNISADSMTNGYISNNDMCISYVAVNDNEMLYVYNDDRGMICLNTGSVAKTFTRVGENIYFGYEELEKEPFNFIQKVQCKLQNYFNEKEKPKQYHI